MCEGWSLLEYSECRTIRFTEDWLTLSYAEVLRAERKEAVPLHGIFVLKNLWKIISDTYKCSARGAKGFL